MKLSQHTRFALALEARGETRVTNTRVAKYTVYTRKGTEIFYFLGTSGALRTGKTAGKSIPVNERFKWLLLTEADKILATNRNAKPSWW